MNDWLAQSAFFGVFISLAAYEVGAVLKKKLGFSILNPLLISVCLVMLALPFLHVKYEVYAEGAQYLSYLLTPATVCLAVPLYRQLELLKRHWKAVLLGIGAGTLASMLGVLVLSALFGLSHSQYVTLLPKSITTAIGMGPIGRNGRRSDDYRCRDYCNGHLRQYHCGACLQSGSFGRACCKRIGAGNLRACHRNG